MNICESSSMVERRVSISIVEGSSPFFRSFVAILAQLVEQRLCNPQVIGSTPIDGSISYKSK